MTERAPATYEDSLMLIYMHRAVGAVAVALPVLVLLIGAVTIGCIPSSISHSYFVPVASDVFAGCLFFIGIAMCFVYRPRLRGAPQYEAFTAFDFGLLFVAGVCALLIAIYPTDGSGCTYSGEMARVFLTQTKGTYPNLPSEPLVTGVINFDLWHRDFTLGQKRAFDLRNYAHAAPTLIMFLILAYVVLRVFTRTNSETSEIAGLKVAEKKRRNRLYHLCGGAILLSIGFIAARFVGLISIPQTGLWNYYVLVWETVGLWAFGAAWLVKGRVSEGLRDPGNRVDAMARNMAR